MADDDDLQLYATTADDASQGQQTVLPGGIAMPAGTTDPYAQLRQMATQVLQAGNQPVQLPSLQRSSGDGTRPGILGLLGEALSGGQSPLYRLRGQQEDLAGSRALLNFGIGMILGSGPSVVKPSLLSAAAQGLQSAQQSMDASQQQAYAQAGQQFEQQKALAALGIQQQDEKIKALTAALPFLRLQQGMGLPNVFGGTSAAPGVTTPPSFGGKALPQMPPEYEPYFQQAARQYNIPVDVLKAQAAQESGFNPNAKGPGGGIGIMQVQPSTAAKPGFGVAGISNPETALLDPATNIMMGAAYLRGRAGNADLSNPANLATALTAYNGGGDPAYAAHVFQYMPGARPAGAQYAGPGVPAAPAVAAPRPQLPPSPTPPPAPPPAAPQAPAVPAQPPAPPPPPPPPAATLEEYRAAHGQGTLDQPDPKDLASLQQNLAYAQQQAEFAQSTGGDMTKASQAVTAATKAIADLKNQARNQFLTSTETGFHNEQQLALDTQKATRRPAQPSELAAAGISPEPGVNYQIDPFGNISMQQVPVDPRLSELSKTDIARFDTEYAKPHDSLIKMLPIMDQMDALRQRMIQNGGVPTGHIGDYARQIQSALTATGFAPDSVNQNMSDADAYQALASQMIMAMKQNAGLPRVTNYDIQLVSQQVPNLSQTMAGQEKLSGMIRQLWNHQDQVYQAANSSIHDRGTGYTLAGLDPALAKLPPAIPQLPADASSWKPEQVQQWRQANGLRKGMVIRMPDNSYETVGN